MKQKAILIIDMPKKCYECPLMSDDMYCKAYAYIVKGRKLCVEDDVMRGIKDIGCPLKPMPKMKDVNEEIVKMFNIGIRDEKSQVAISNQVRGYNWCIDEILGEQNERRTEV